MYCMYVHMYVCMYVCMYVQARYLRSVAAAQLRLSVSWHCAGFGEVRRLESMRPSRGSGRPVCVYVCMYVHIYVYMYNVYVCMYYMYVVHKLELYQNYEKGIVV